VTLSINNMTTLKYLFETNAPKKLGMVGSRKWPDPKFVVDTLTDILDQYPSIEIIVSGDQPKGVDGIAKAYAERKTGITYKGYPPAHWKDKDDPEYRGYHVSNFFDRNTQIAENIDILMAFCYEGSKGTLDTYNKARGRDKVVLLFTEEDLS